jgi:hypothetical protein
MHALSGGIDAHQVAACGHHGHRDRALDAPYGLERLDHGLEAPGVHRVLECVCETRPARGLCGPGVDGCLKDHVRRRGRTDHLTEPAPGGRAPIGSPGRADSVPPPEGVEPPLGRLQIPEGIFTRPAQVADGFSVDGGHLPRREVPGAHQPGPWPGVTPVGVDPVAWLLGKQGGGDDPADGAGFRQVALAPGAAGASVVDEDERLTLRLQMPQQLINIALPGPDRAEGDHLCAMCLGDRGDRDGLLMHIHADVARARLGHG